MEENDTQEEYKDVMRLRREKTGRTKAQLDLSLATPVKYNKKCLYKCISNKNRTKDNFHFLSDVEGNIVMKDEEKAEVCNALFASVLSNKTSFSVGMSWKMRTMSRKKPP